MFRLPPTDHPARQLVDVAALAVTLDPANAMQLPAVWQARREAEPSLAAAPAAHRVCVVVLRADTGDRWLVRFGRRGGWRKEWNFGNGG
jgi:hypothetical protein